MTQQYNPNYLHAPTPEQSVIQFRIEKLGYALQLSELTYATVTEPIITVSHMPASPSETYVAPQPSTGNVDAIRQLVDESFISPTVEGQPAPEVYAPSNVIELHKPLKPAPNEFPLDELYGGQRSA